ncbi:MAG: hypothetical protein AB7N65_14325 [Vicinamibacterales bacterium]
MNTLHAVARTVLLDALEALNEQRDAVVLVGAQAIYLHTGDAEIAVPAFTTDGDLVIEPARLKDEPRLVEAMERAQFAPGRQPGSWVATREVDSVVTTIPVDLLVPEAVAGGGHRAARLGNHGDRTGRRARGLEGALVDYDFHTLRALAPDDPRAFDIRVAGPSALLVAKAHKISDRNQEPQAKRLGDKDGLDVLRLLRGVESRRLADGLLRLRQESVSATVTSEAIAQLADLFGSPDAVGTQMAVRATERLEDPRVIAESCTALTRELLSLVRS